MFIFVIVYYQQPEYLEIMEQFELKTKKNDLSGKINVNSHIGGLSYCDVILQDAQGDQYFFIDAACKSLRVFFAFFKQFAFPCWFRPRALLSSVKTENRLNLCK